MGCSSGDRGFPGAAHLGSDQQCSQRPGKPTRARRVRRLDYASTRRDVAAAAAQHAHDLERGSVAREFHDVIAHQLSAIAVQAGAARLASLSNPEAASQAVTAIEQDARHGLVELNRLVGALHREPGERLDRAPQPQLRDLPDLIERAKESGLPAELVIEGEPRPLPAAAELAGYKERARLLGGQLDAGRRPDRGFVVRAWLPAGP